MYKTAAHNKEIKKYEIKHKTVSVKNYSLEFITVYEVVQRTHYERFLMGTGTTL